MPPPSRPVNLSAKSIWSRPSDGTYMTISVFDCMSSNLFCDVCGAIEINNCHEGLGSNHAYVWYTPYPSKGMSYPEFKRSVESMLSFAIVFVEDTKERDGLERWRDI